jgi:hypothetical protein
MGISPEVVATKKEGREKVSDAWAATEVETVSKMYLENFEQIDKSPPKCRQTRDPDLRDQIPKRPHHGPFRHGRAQLTPLLLARDLTSSSSPRAQLPQ